MDSATRRSLRDLTQHGPLQKHYSCDLSGFLTRWATMIRRSWMAAMTGGSVEATLELWALSLRDVKGRIRPLFQPALNRSSVRHSWNPRARRELSGASCEQSCDQAAS